MITRKEIKARCVEKKCTIGNIKFEELASSSEENPEFRGELNGNSFYLFNNFKDGAISISSFFIEHGKLKDLVGLVTEIHKTLGIECETLPEFVKMEVEKPTVNFIGLDEHDHGVLRGKIEAYERLLRPFNNLNV